ncbi:S-methyl-5-thioribose kinase [Trypanosoma grayi]|uniref:S-methyl-5-thioribose kinase n=1 Tax=Trypanosoma grayi TaxID=71804 RepID=UPI0004F43188|nr:S-methyl-5-thioribose kinase [Trypanosoma grayi]KEG15268.1 S-methyl-5-thioribose kinase [Trypanosoma grayi]
MGISCTEAVDVTFGSYVTLKVDTVVEFARRTFRDWQPLSGDAGAIDSPDMLVSAVEVGDGNLNLVFRLLDRNGRSCVVVKQALPYVRCVGASWPLTVDRARIEAQTLQVHRRCCPEGTVSLLYYDSRLAVLVLEDMSHCVTWRHALVGGVCSMHVAAGVGIYLAKVLFFTSDLFLSPEEKRREMQRFVNVEMCRITEDLFFTDPFIVHERNDYEAGLEDYVQSHLRDDVELRQRVAVLKRSFMTRAEALLHGDIHTGSVFVSATQTKVFDAEFGFYGPMGFDLGTVVGNLLLNHVALPELLQQRRDQQDQRAQEGTDFLLSTSSPTAVLESIGVFWRAFATCFQNLAEEYTKDATFAVTGYARRYIEEEVWRDTLGFAGLEMIRRTVGLAHAADLDAVRDTAARLRAKRAALHVGRRLVVQATSVTDVDELLRFVV